VNEATKAASAAEAATATDRRWVGFRTIVIREFSRIVRIWGQTLVPPAITATLYFLIFGSLIGRRIGEMGGFTYMQYIAPGLIMMAVITSSYGNVVSSFFGAKFGRHIEELLVAPLPNWLIVLGYVAGGILTPLTYLGGVFYSITMLPEWAQHMSRSNPILYMVNAFRYGFLGISDVPVGFSFAIMAAAVAALFALSVWLMEKGTGTRE
jgi:ABC-type multidrug transport system permease subunit